MKIIKKGARLNYNAKTLSRYRFQLKSLVRRMTTETIKKLISLFRSGTGESFRESQKQLLTTDDSIASQSNILINKLKSKFTQLFNEKSKPLAEQMVKSNVRSSKQKLNADLKTLAKEITIPDTLISKNMPKNVQEIAKTKIIENVNLIKSIPQKYFTDISTKVMQNISSGGNIQKMVEDLSKNTGITERRAKDIAEDQVRKSYNAVAFERMKANGTKKFEWLHSGGGQHPRKSHEAMDGKIFRMDKLPIVNQEQVDKGYEGPRRGIPGQEINCRCTMRPIFEFEEAYNTDEDYD